MRWDARFNQLIAQNFSNPGYFAVSSLGKPPDISTDMHHGIFPRRVCDPVLWILSKFGLIRSNN